MSFEEERGKNWEDSKKKRIYLQICDYETKEFSGLTTYHGLVRIYNSNTWPSRIFWCVVVLSCLFLFMVHSGFLLLNYHSKPTLFQVNVIVPEEGIPFPDVTICNTSPVDPRKVAAWNMSDSVLKYVLKAYLEALDDDVPGLEKEHREFINYTKHYEKANQKPFSFLEFFRLAGNDCESLVEWCAFGGVPLQDCCNATQKILTDSGLCIRFTNTNRRQWFSGWAHGWQILLRAGVSFEDDNLLPDVFADEGVRVAVHENNEFPSMRAQSISVPPETALYAGMDVKNITLLARHDWGLCQPGWDPALHGDLIVPFEYSSRHCEANCLMKRYIEACGCVPLAYTLADQYAICTPLELAGACKESINNSATCACDVKCEQMEYELKTSYGNLGRGDRDHSSHKETDPLILVNVYMREISYERHEQQKQLQTADLLSNIAGSMGLFLGMSTVTLLEIFIYLFKSVWGTINSDRQKQFAEAMLLEENELLDEQQLIVVEDEPNEPFSTPQSPDLMVPTERRPSRRISIVPLSQLTLNPMQTGGPHRRSISMAAPMDVRRVSLAAPLERRRASHQESVITLGVPSTQHRNSFSSEDHIRLNLRGRRNSAVQKRLSIFDF
ncbi:unnamed protein product, partial [Mesorhabditis spiculigera]